MDAHGLAWAPSAYGAAPRVFPPVRSSRRVFQRKADRTDHSAIGVRDMVNQFVATEREFHSINLSLQLRNPRLALLLACVVAEDRRQVEIRMLEQGGF